MINGLKLLEFYFNHANTKDESKAIIFLSYFTRRSIFLGEMFSTCCIGIKQPIISNSESRN